MSNSGRQGKVAAAPRQLARAAEWRLLSLLLERPRAGWRDEIAALRREVGSVRLSRAATAVLGATEGEYLRLIGPGGAVSPREVAYRGYEDPGWVLSDLAAFYQAFGFQPRAEDPMDHVAVEAGFVGYLFLKEAFARAAGDRAGAALTADARTRFLQTHLAPLAGGFAQRLAAVAPGYLIEPARLLAAKVPKSAPAPLLEEPEVIGGCGACTVQP